MAYQYQQSVFKRYHSDKHFSGFYLQDGGKNQLAQIWNKIIHCHSMYSIRCGHCCIYSVVRQRLSLLAQGTITVLDGARIYH